MKRLHVVLILVGCGEVRPPDAADADIGVDADTDVDSDADTDTDVDLDGGLDAGADADSGTDGSVTDAGPSCKGWISPDIGGCWYEGELAGTCSETCAERGGFDPDSTILSVDAEVCFYFHPDWEWRGVGGAGIIEMAHFDAEQCAEIDPAYEADGEFRTGTAVRPVCSCFK